MKQLSLKPFLVYVPGGPDARPHFRGGDDFIVPVDEISNPELLDAVAFAFQKSRVPMTEDEVVAALSNRFSKADICAVTALLLEGGVLWCAPSSDQQDFLRNYLSRFSSDVAPLQERLQRADVYLWGEGEGRKEMIDSFALHGLFVRTGNAPPPKRTPELIVALGGFDTESLFHTVDDYCRRREVPWIVAVRCGPEQAQIGPLFIPEETACYRCFQLRTASNRSNYEQYVAFRQLTEIPPRKGIWPEAYARFVASVTALECVRFILDVAPAVTVGTAYYWDLMSWTPTVESVLKLPGCPCCGVSYDP